MKRCLCLLAILAIASPLHAQKTKPRPMALDDLFGFQRLADPQVSPDGRHVVYAAGKVDLAGNRTVANLWLAPTDAKLGKPRQLTAAPKSDRHPRWSPDGKYILFESSRSGSSQLWFIPLAGGEARQLTSISTGAATAIWSRDGKRIAFVSAVWPEFSAKPFKESDALNKKRLDEKTNSPIQARVFTRLFFRHWDEYVEDKRQHLFVLDVAHEAGGLKAVSEPRDVTPGDHDAYPTSMTFSIGDDFTFSPDGKYLYYTAPPEKDEAWSTDYNIYRVPVAGGAKECITEDNLAADSGPQFSPDGKWLAYRAQARPGFEADRWQLMVVPNPPLPPLLKGGKEQTAPPLAKGGRGG